MSFLLQEHRDAKDQRDKEIKDPKKYDFREPLKESKKAKDYKEMSGLEKFSKKPAVLAQNSQGLTASQQETAGGIPQQSSSPPHVPHATVGASTCNAPTCLYGPPGNSTPATPLDTFVSGHAHGKQLSPIQSASTLRNSPTQDPAGAGLSRGSVGTMTTSPGMCSKGGSSHIISISKTNIGLGMVGQPRHESPPGPPQFR